MSSGIMKAAAIALLAAALVGSSLAAYAVLKASIGVPTAASVRAVAGSADTGAGSRAEGIR